MTSRGRYARRVVGASLALLALAVVAGAHGAAPSHAPHVRYTKADLALARRAVLHQADMGSTSTWVGGSRAPDVTKPPSCADYHPDRSQLVVTGAAASSFSARALGLEVNSEAQVLRTPRMLSLAWRRTVEPAAVLACMGGVFARSAGGQARVVAERRFRFPSVAPLTAGFRFLIDIGVSGKLGHYLVDFVVAGKGRAEISLTTVAFLGLTRLSAHAETRAETSLTRNEVTLARALVTRAVPPSPLAA